MRLFATAVVLLSLSSSALAQDKKPDPAPAPKPETKKPDDKKPETPRDAKGDDARTDTREKDSRSAENGKAVTDYTVKDIDGKDVPLSKYKGKVLLLVNVASKCGYTKQYAQLEQLHEKYGPQGLAILAFPANNFGGQEPGTNEEIKTFCKATYNVGFDVFAKISVKGEDCHPLYRMLTASDKVGGDIKWNFTKFLVGRDGKLVSRYEPAVKPDADEVVKAIETALAASPDKKPG